MKSIKTVQNYKESVSVLKDQIKSLRSLVKLDKTYADDIKPIIAEKKHLLDYITSNKTWNFNFKSGGWNCVTAKTEEQAIKLAKKTYPTLEVLETSFRVATEADTQALLSSFY